MTTRKDVFATDEWYHCYNQSIDRRTAFEDEQDYRRFLELLYVANDQSPLRYGDLRRNHAHDIFAFPRSEPLVSVGAFCLLETRFHLALKEVRAGGISSFMRKVGTAYTMYFNARHARKGNLFLKPFQSLPAPSENDLQRLVSFIHSSPAGLYEQEWKTGTVVDPQFLEERLVAYRYSSLGLHLGKQKPLHAILDGEIFSRIHVPSMHKMLQEARSYHHTYPIVP